MKRLIFVIASIIIIFSISTSSLAASYIITGDYVNMRSSPIIEENNIIEKLNYGDSIQIYDIYKDWYLIGCNKKLGYVSADYIGLETTGTAGITTADLNFRKGPGKKYNSYTVIPKDTIVKVTDTSSKWYQIQYEDLLGYVSSDYLTLKKFKNEELLGVYTTSFSTASSQKGRVKNIEKSASLIDTLTIASNSSFSLLDAIGPITKSGGYYSAPEYIQTTDGTQTVIGYGGGVCQLATTLYQSICNAKFSGSNIDITERHQHSKSVSYIEDGEDATISWSSKKDFSFENNNDYSIKIRTIVNDGTVTCMIYRCN